MPELTNEKLKRLSDIVMSRNAKHTVHRLPQWMKNYRDTARVFDTMKEQEPPRVPKGVLSAFQEGHKNRDVIVFASGPTLNHYLSRLHKIHWSRYVVFASPTNVSALLAFGIIPDFIMISDPSAEQRKFLDLVPFKMPLLVSPMTALEVTSYPYADKYWFLQYFQDEHQNVNHWWNAVSKAMFPEIPDFVVQAGCVTNQTLLLIDLAMRRNLINPKRIILLGADYSYPERASFRVHKYELSSMQKRKPVFHKVKEDTQNRIQKNEQLLKVNGILTNTQMAHYKVSLMTLWNALKLPLFRSLDCGILSEIPYIENRDLLSNQLPEPYAPFIIAERVTAYFTSDEIEGHVL